MKVSIIGAGSWGTALASAVKNSGCETTLFFRDAAKAREVSISRINPRLPDFSLDKSIRVSSEEMDLVHSDLLIFATPAQALRSTAQAIAHLFNDRINVVIASKGIEQASRQFMSDVVHSVSPKFFPLMLSGPSFANDVVRDLPTAVTVASNSLDVSLFIAKNLSSRNFRIYASNDLRGVEFGGAAKNVIAIACGMAEGLGLGESARAALMTRGFSELVKMGVTLGGSKETLFGLSGLGDLLLTASSQQSRNFSLGYRLARNEEQDANPLIGISEGAWTAPVLLEMALDLGIEMPVTEAVVRVLSGETSCSSEANALLSRPLRMEF